jgi:hypothetical protein
MGCSLQLAHMATRHALFHRHDTSTGTKYPPISHFNTGNYFPRIIQSFGFSKLKANALSSIGPVGAVLIVMVLAFISDKTRYRGLTVLAPLGALAIFEGVLFALPADTNKWTNFAVVCLIQSQTTIWHTLNVTWLSTNCVTVKDRALGLPLVIMAANAAGMIGPQTMQASDAPRYRKGLTAAITLTTFAWFFGATISAGYFWWNKTRRAKGQLQEDYSVNEWVAEIEGQIGGKKVARRFVREVRRRFVYTW